MLGAVLLCQPLLAGERQVLVGGWEFWQGDAAFEELGELDEGLWSPVAVPGLLKQEHGKPTAGWYRRDFDVPAAGGGGQALALVIECIRHADETWLNGVRIGGEGHFEPPWHFSATNPQGLLRSYAIPDGLLRPTGNRLFIKTPVGFGDAWGAMFPGGAGIVRGEVALQDAESAEALRHRALIHASMIDSVFVTLGILDVLIIVLLLGRSQTVFPEFKWLVAVSLLMLLGVAGHDIFYINGWQIYGNLLLIVALLGVPPTIALYFRAQYHNVPGSVVKAMALLWLLAVLLMFAPSVSPLMKRLAWYLYSAIAFVSLLYALFCAVRGVREKRVAAVAQLLALVVYLLSIRTQWLPDVFFGHRNVQIGSLFYRYALLYAYLARVRQMQIDYKHLSRRVVGVADTVHANLSRELHDGIGQKLASMKLQAQLAGRGDEEGATNPHVQNIRHELDGAVDELQQVLAGLHPVQLDRCGLQAAIRQSARHLEKLHRGVAIAQFVEAVELGKDTELQLFRIFQESVNNAIRHGKASKISVHLIRRGKVLELKVQDNGKGFDVNARPRADRQGGLGLVSLYERAALLNGHLSIDSLRDAGTCITVTVPLEA